jgi:hypothetical protein
MLSLASEKGHQFNAVNWATCMHRMAKNYSQEVRSHSKKILSLFSKIKANMPILDFQLQHLATLVWSMAKTGVVDSELKAELACRAASLSESLKPQDLANLIWSLKKMNDKLNLSVFVEVFESRVSDLLGNLKTMEMSSILWSIAESNFKLKPETLKSIESGFLAVRSLNEYTPQGQANIVYSLAKFGVKSSNLIDLILAQPVVSALSKFKPQEAATLIQGLSKIPSVSDSFRNSCLQVVLEKFPNVTGDMESLCFLVTPMIGKEDALAVKEILLKNSEFSQESKYEGLLALVNRHEGSDDSFVSTEGTACLLDVVFSPETSDFFFPSNSPVPAVEVLVSAVETLLSSGFQADKNVLEMAQLLCRVLAAHLIPSLGDVNDLAKLLWSSAHLLGFDSSITVDAKVALASFFQLETKWLVRVAPILELGRIEDIEGADPVDVLLMEALLGQEKGSTTQRWSMKNIGDKKTPLVIAALLALGEKGHRVLSGIPGMSSTFITQTLKGPLIFESGFVIKLRNQVFT